MAAVRVLRTRSNAAFPALAFQAVTAFERAGGLALAGAAVTTAATSETAKRWTNGTAAPIDGVRWTPWTLDDGGIALVVAR